MFPLSVTCVLSAWNAGGSRNAAAAWRRGGKGTRNDPRTVNLVSAFNTCREEVMRRDEREEEGGVAR